MHKEASFTHTTFYNTLSRVVTMLLFLGLNIYTSRWLPVAEYGETQFMLWITSFTWLVFHLGIPGAFTRYLPLLRIKRDRKGMDVFIAYILMLSLLVLAISAIMVLLYPDIRSSLRWQCFVLVMLNVAFQVLVSWLQGALQYRSLFISQSASAVIMAVGAYFLIPSRGIDGFFLCQVCFFVSGVVLMLPLVFKEWNKRRGWGSELQAEPITRKKLLRFTAYLAPSALLAGILWQRGEMYLLQHFLGFEQIGVYSVALTLGALSTEPFKMLTGTLTPHLSALAAAEPERLEKLFYKMYTYLWVMVAFTGVFVAFHASPIIKMIFGEKFQASAPVLQYLLIGMVPGICGYVVMSLHLALGRAKLLFTQDIVCAASLVGLGFWALTSYGIIGLVLAKSFTFLLSAAIGLFYTFYRLRFQLPIRNMFISLLVSFALASSTVWFPYAECKTGLIALFLMSGVVYLVLLRWLRVITNTDLTEWKNRIQFIKSGYIT